VRRSSGGTTSGATLPVEKPGVEEAIRAVAAASPSKLPGTADAQKAHVQAAAQERLALAKAARAAAANESDDDDEFTSEDEEEVATNNRRASLVLMQVTAQHIMIVLRLSL
jgi:hypothetical protein